VAGLVCPLRLDMSFDLYSVRNFFDRKTCQALITEMCGAPMCAATVYGQGEAGSVDGRVRKAARLMPSPDTVHLVVQRLLEVRTQVGKHFELSLHGCEEPQFLRYREGDFFVAHQDGNTGMIRSARDQSRKVSIVIFLNQQTQVAEREGYCGGSLVFSDWRQPVRKDLSIAGEAGMMVTFRSETTHEVVPVTHGERYSIVSWYE
jgi:SM-20-related protein